MSGINFLDIVFLLIICLFLFRGFWNGLIKEVSTIAALVCGLGGAYLFFQPVAGRLMEWGLKTAAPVIAFLIVFAAIYLLISIVAHFLQSIIETINLGALNRLLGMILGFLEGFIIVYVLLTLITLQPFEGLKNLLNESWSKNIIDNNLYSLTAYLDGIYERLSETVSHVADGAGADV